MLIFVKVNPNSKENKIEEILINKTYIIHVKSKSINNKANLDVIKLVSKYFKTSSSNIRILRGLTSRRKILEVKI